MKSIVTACGLHVCVNQFCSNPAFYKLLIFQNDIGFILINQKAIPIAHNSVVLVRPQQQVKILKADSLSYYCFGYGDLSKESLTKSTKNKIQFIEEYLALIESTKLPTDWIENVKKQIDDLDQLYDYYFNLVPDDIECKEAFEKTCNLVYQSIKKSTKYIYFENIKSLVEKM
ncbi:MAG: hypothetical protein IPJ79_01085 [Bacteroidetes bacterium]|nr:hypothetical protein [Bacteroidota bacterium]